MTNPGAPRANGILALADGRYTTVDGFRGAMNTIRIESIRMANVLNDMGAHLGAIMSVIETRHPDTGLSVVMRQTVSTAKGVRTLLTRSGMSMEAVGVQAVKAWVLFQKGILLPAQQAEEQYRIRQNARSSMTSGGSTGGTRAATFTGVPNSAAKQRKAS